MAKSGFEPPSFRCPSKYCNRLAAEAGSLRPWKLGLKPAIGQT